MLVVNALLALAVELAALAAFAWFGWWLAGGGVLGIALGLVFVLGFALLWGRFAAPKAKARLRMPGLMVFKFAIFDAAALALWASGLPIPAIALVIAGSLQIALAHRLDAL